MGFRLAMQFMKLRRHTIIMRVHAGFTLIELLEAIVAIALATWLADIVSSHFEGTWHTVAFWIVRIACSVVFFLCLLCGFGYLFHYLDRRRIPKTTDENHPQYPA